MKILVTGANGYLGRGIVKRLVEQGESVIATDLTTCEWNEGFDFRECNIFNIEDPFNYFSMPDVVLHLAWRNGFVHNAETHLADLPLHNKFIGKLMNSGIERICVMGSMHEIGFWEGCITEKTPCNPMTQYGIAKNSLRQSLELLTREKNTEFMWLRGFYIVGEDTKGCSVFSKIAQAAQKGCKTFPLTSGQNQYDFIDYDLFCEKVAAATVQQDSLGIINICSGFPEKLRDRVERFVQQNGFNIKMLYGAYPDRPYDSKAVWGDSKKIDMICRKNIEEVKDRYAH